VLIDHILPSCGFKTVIREVNLEELCQADAVFMSNTLMGVRSVESIAETSFVAAPAMQKVEHIQLALAEHLS
jgi:branched-subunit amino acid aminotransferase/4-amino-4-deoxychorismate lyase